MIQALFSDIKDELLQRISDSNSCIKIAVAWFTNRDLFAAILDALDRGVDIDLIIVDDIINRNIFGLNFSEFIKKGGKLCFADNKKSLMHHKFCIFDNKIVASGSYNWTYTAESKNSENIIVTDDSKVCENFEIHFLDIWDKLKPRLRYSQIQLSDYNVSKLLQEYNILEEEFSILEKNHIFSSADIKSQLEVKNTIIVAKAATISTATNRQQPVAKMNIGMRCIVNGIDGRTLNIIPKGRPLPFTRTVDTQTSVDNQTRSHCQIVYGNNDKADLNKPLVKLNIEDLPPKKEGQVKFKTKITLDTNGYMHVEHLCVNTGVSKETVYVDSELVKY